MISERVSLAFRTWVAQLPYSLERQRENLLILFLRHKIRGFPTMTQAGYPQMSSLLSKRSITNCSPQSGSCENRGSAAGTNVSQSRSLLLPVSCVIIESRFVGSVAEFCLSSAGGICPEALLGSKEGKGTVPVTNGDGEESCVTGGGDEVRGVSGLPSLVDGLSPCWSARR